MRMGILYYLIFTGICAIIPGIGWLTWIGATLIIIAYNFLVTGYNTEEKKKELEKLKEEKKGKMNFGMGKMDFGININIGGKCYGVDFTNNYNNSYRYNNF